MRLVIKWHDQSDRRTAIVDCTDGPTELTLHQISNDCEPKAPRPIDVEILRKSRSVVAHLNGELRLRS